MKKIRKLLKDEKGFTMIEVLTAMVILAIGILGLAPLIVTSIYGNSFSNDVSLAKVIAQDRIEEFRALPVINPIPYSDSTMVNGVYSRLTRVDTNSSDGSVPTDLYKIVVTIKWTDKEQRSRSTTYVTFRNI